MKLLLQHLIHFLHVVFLLVAITSYLSWYEYVRTWLSKFVRKGVEQHLVLILERTYF
jgi:hypothetical protein